MIDPTPCLLLAHDPDAFGALFLLVWLLWVGVIGCLIVPLMIFWIWMIVDCAKNERSEGNDKVVWILVICLAQWVGALIYFFARRPARKRELGR